MNFRKLALAILLVAFTIVPALGGGPDVLEPDLRVVAWRVDDTVAGNGDGGLHPGETAALYVTLSNQGSAHAEDVYGILSETVDHPDVRVTVKSGRWDTVSASGEANEQQFSSWAFEIQVEKTRPCRWRIPLTLELTAAEGYSVTREFEIEMVDAQTIDLVDIKGRPVIWGRDDSDLTGDALATGDLDGDGYDDLLIGVPGGDGPAGSRNGAGEVVILYGQRFGFADIDLLSPPAHVGFIYGPDAGDACGYGVAAADFDGDGLDDVLMSCVSADGANDDAAGTGEAWIVFSAADRFTSKDLDSNPSRTNRIYGAGDGDGIEAVLAADLDGNGFPEAVVTSRFYDDGGAQQSIGSVGIVYGPFSTGNGNFYLSGTSERVSMVYGIHHLWSPQDLAAGDLDGDHRDELIIMARGGLGPEGDRGGIGAGAGEAVVIYGQDAMHDDFDMSALPDNVRVIHGSGVTNLAYDRLAFGDAGDVDGDGYDDLLLGARVGRGPSNASQPGRVYVVYGQPTRLPEIDLLSPPDGVGVVSGRGSGDYMSQVGIGDTDGDGHDDLLLGAFFADGAAGDLSSSGELYRVPGRAEPIGWIDLATEIPDVTTVYADAGDELGSIITAGDFDGDGYVDTVAQLAGHDGPDGTRFGAGAVMILPGAPSSRYRWDDDPYSFIDATGGTDVGLACDDCSVTVPIGFDFDFFGQKKAEVTISSNGYLTFGDFGHQPRGECPFRSSPPNDVIAVFWQDLDLSQGGAVYTLLEGVAPNRRFTVQWDNVPDYTYGDAGTFEVTLFESSDQILMQYLDTQFGDYIVDDGHTAIAGVENATGRYSMLLSECDNDNLQDGTAFRMRRFANPTLHYADDFENTSLGWSWTGQWLFGVDWSDPACGDPSRSGNVAFHYGGEFDCVDPASTPETATVDSPVIASLPQDATLTYWSRSSVASGDQTSLHVSADGGAFESLIYGPGQNKPDWRFTDDILSDGPQSRRFTPLDLSEYQGQDVQVRWQYANNNYGDYGWTIDDVEVRGCPVYDAGTGQMDGAASEARATPSTPEICETDPGRVDAVGSYCAGCPDLAYQWSVDGSPIAGATGVAYDVPPGESPGVYDYTVDITCATGGMTCDDTSNDAGVRVVQFPGTVGPTLAVERIDAGVNLRFTWGDVTGADLYTVRTDADPAGGFTADVGTAGSGVTGVIAPTPEDDLVFFLVGGSNPTCGDGNLR